MELVDVYFRVDQRPVTEPIVEVKPAVQTAAPSSATITIKSHAKEKPIKVMGSQGPLFMANGVVTAGKQTTSVDTPVIDWSASATSGQGNANTLSGNGSDNNWITDFFGTKEKQKDLAKTTGLKVTLGGKDDVR
jgi:hypothetical protein